jgi:hypothetical protein
VRAQEHRSGALLVLWTTTAILLFVYLAGFGLSAAVRLTQPFEFVYGESIVLAVTRRVMQGEALYPPTDRLPLVVTAYTPLYYVVVGGLQRLFGDGYAAGRAVSLIATLGAAGLLARSVRCVSGCWTGGLLAGGLFLTQNMTALLWAPLHRVDALALFLTLSGLALATTGRVYVAAVSFLLALLTKQSYVVAPIVVCIALWPDWRKAVGFGSVLSAGLGVAILGAHVFSGGWFWWHTLGANANEFDALYVRNLLGQFLQLNAVPLLAAATLFSLQPRPGERLWRLYFLGTLLVLPGLAKLGASSNYWLEATAASCALIGVLANRLAAQRGVPTAITELGLAMMVVASLVVAVPGYQASAHEVRRYLPSGAGGVIRAQAELGPMLAAEPGELLTDEPALAIAAGKPVVFEFQIFQLLAMQGLWDERPIIEAIEARRFALAVFSRPLDAPGEQTRWTAAVREALLASYRPAGNSHGYWFYRPIGPPDV